MINDEGKDLGGRCEGDPNWKPTRVNEPMALALSEHKPKALGRGLEFPERAATGRKAGLL